MASKYLGRTAILGIRPKLEVIDDIPNWDGCIYIRELTVDDVRRVTALRTKNVDALRISATYMISAVCDEVGQPIFTVDDADALMGQLGYNAVNHIVNRILILSDLLDAPDDEKSENDSGNEPD